jgi:sterol desaturase/sphingolipid hydroxylase (fatty acid hydroxylase superfamily)
LSATADLALAISRNAWILLAAAFCFFALWETFAPSREPRMATASRWWMNLALWILGAICWRSIAGAGAVAVAVWASPAAGPAKAWQFAVTILLLDLARYGFHRVAHALPWCWRVHLVHHSDPEVDCTSGLRIHPVEAIAEHAWVIALVYGLALPPLAVALSELVTIFVDVAEHANIALAPRFGRAIGLVFVTPEIHRTHHSADPRDHGRNFGTVFVVWDRLFGTYAQTPERPLDFGVEELGRMSTLSLIESLNAPFRR